MRFVGRQRDLEQLSRHYREVAETGAGCLISMRGRRRVGKSTLVEEFIRRDGVPHVFFVASRQSTARELELFCAELAASDLPAGERLREGLIPNSWEAVLTLLADTADSDQPAVVVIDEFPWLVEQDPSIEAVVQKVWDRKLQAAPVMLILVGSDLAMMEALTTYGRPLYGRPTREMVVSPLTPAEIAELLDTDPADALDAYVVIGGFPQLASNWPSGASHAEFLEGALEDPHSPFIVNGERSVTAEFPPRTGARAVLSAIGAGEVAFNRISQRTEMVASQVAATLTVLETKRAIRRLVPFAAKESSRAKRYVVADPYLRFWLRFIEPNMELIERGRGRLVAERIAAGWEEYRGKAIEPIVIAALERLVPDERFGETRHVSGYWTRDNLVEVDLVGAAEQRDPKRATMVGSVKWRERAPFTRHDAQQLVELRGKAPLTDPETLLVGVSRQGFERNLGLDVQLGPADILEAWR